MPPEASCCPFHVAADRTHDVKLDTTAHFSETKTLKHQSAGQCTHRARAKCPITLGLFDRKGIYTNRRFVKEETTVAYWYPPYHTGPVKVCPPQLPRYQLPRERSWEVSVNLKLVVREFCNLVPFPF